MLGLTYRGSERFAEAAQAFRRAAELAPRNADYAAYLGEALLLAGGDAPPPRGRAAVPPRARAPARQPAGALLSGDAEGHGRRPSRRGRRLVACCAKRRPTRPGRRRCATRSTAIAPRAPYRHRRPPAAAAAPPADRDRRHSRPDARADAAARAIPPSQQDQMVRAMVDGLAARLRQNPRDADGWIRLMRSRMVLHDPRRRRGAALRASPPSRATRRPRRGCATRRASSAFQRRLSAIPIASPPRSAGRGPDLRNPDRLDAPVLRRRWRAAGQRPVGAVAAHHQPVAGTPARDRSRRRSGRGAATDRYCGRAGRRYRYGPRSGSACS